MNTGRLAPRLAGIAAVAIVLGLTAAGCSNSSNATSTQDQAHRTDLARQNAATVQCKSDPKFYDPPSSLPSLPGTLIKCEQIAVPSPKSSLIGAVLYRIMYTSAKPDGSTVAVSGMAFVPTNSSAGVRNVLAWAHGTVGAAHKCAPSVTSNHLADMASWINTAVANNWDVVATDYSGLGVSGEPTYLVGSREAADVLNSVRALGQLPNANPGKTFAIYGHSQGGHAGIEAASQASAIAPELNLVGVSVAAPAIEIGPVVKIQWNKALGWVIGAQGYPSWVVAYPKLDITNGRSAIAGRLQPKLDKGCTTSTALTGTDQVAQKHYYFSEDPNDLVNGAHIAADQTPQPLPAQIPIQIAQGLKDQVIPAVTNIDATNVWCSAGSTLTSVWDATADHFKIVADTSAGAMSWLADRFANKPAGNTCATPPPTASE